MAEEFLDTVLFSRRIRELIAPVLASREVVLVDLTCRKESGRWMLRFLVGRGSGITLDELGALNKAIGAVIEEHELLPERSVLEVNSPGLDRRLRTETDFLSVIGRRLVVTLGLVTPASLPAGRQARTEQVIGKLIRAETGVIWLELGSGESRRVDLADIQHAVQEIKI